MSACRSYQYMYLIRRLLLKNLNGWKNVNGNIMLFFQILLITCEWVLWDGWWDLVLYLPHLCTMYMSAWEFGNEENIRDGYFAVMISKQNKVFCRSDSQRLSWIISELFYFIWFQAFYIEECGMASASESFYARDHQY